MQVSIIPTAQELNTLITALNKAYFETHNDNELIQEIVLLQKKLEYLVPIVKQKDMQVSIIPTVKELTVLAKALNIAYIHTHHDNQLSEEMNVLRIKLEYLVPIQKY